MVKNKNNWFIYSFFSWYISRLVHKHFHQLVYNSVPIDTNKSILLIANHYSWWDGFLFFHLNKLLFKKKFHVMILEKTIRKNSFMKYTGAFSVSKGSKSIMQTLKYAGDLLNNPQNLVLIFPQGKLHSNFTKAINFEKGLERIIGFSKQKFQYIFAASFTEHFSEAKPTAFIYLKSFEASNFAGLENVQSAYQEHYQQSGIVQTAIVK
ncbi:1-acyl-sn-glycerol-3-phosphate acyltransferase [Mucilaginibacter arboris]|uniref:Glycerol acyltransferase n=1 Tax=Mucilaginibacter arboris TaxID=2682090 RepID=A0A7K1T118_9SPHI|nr:1-acyl-sn-glycerol-3-phosphate acyltransferase [Mucilaginibacter arboris]MVN23227.1 glycerol acyltransferase [Mucilaginibacter arboris]